ncbi:hypothetical protein M2475_001809 [Breznakia sp. PF5-3]|uniref:hypothetical protein n=1 Tax=unclassified Breznakia TaxID=2623764 RepID=UPI0024071BE6|nr:MULTISPECIES: hypothetical protein [unclassified Breznakia]MDF9825354.1 hypothetical protein [Breznakia sp. PM6-1]MDF9836232.1 hypothetical protein [Breznakia sp. PF5-3]MDF9838528.1 hypothetical protein [Breznakia sp. PFB2-8]MDF9860477.1 hypothetical protein [Breznakia sp. PH5-24]
MIKKSILVILIIVCCGCTHDIEKKTCTYSNNKMKDEVIFTIKNEEVINLNWKMERRIFSEDNKLSDDEKKRIIKNVLKSYSFESDGVDSQAEIVEFKLYATINIDFNKIKNIEEFTRLTSLEIENKDNVSYSKLKKQLKTKADFICE